MSLPCGFSTLGLPIGMQIAARPFEESLVFKVGHAYQRLTDFHTRTPPQFSWG
jgi:aspartyl-tRNA(Asn)/glutamyl-tRNA(Gln) amidotransferase subunit A